MIRHTLAVAMLLSLTLLLSRASAQDMNLHQILADGEVWKGMPRGNFKSPEKLFGERKSRTFAHAVQANRFYFTVPGERAIFLVEVNGGQVSRHDVPLTEPADVELWLDEGTLVVGDAAGKHLWAFRLGKDGAPTDGEPYYPLFVRPGQKRSGVSWLTRDDQKRIYAATPEGIQVFDPTGRLSGIIAAPVAGAAAGELGFLSLSGHELMTGVGDRVYTRKLQASARSEAAAP